MFPSCFVSNFFVHPSLLAFPPILHLVTPLSLAAQGTVDVRAMVQETPAPADGANALSVPVARRKVRRKTREEAKRGLAEPSWIHQEEEVRSGGTGTSQCWRLEGALAGSPWREWERPAYVLLAYVLFIEPVVNQGPSVLTKQPDGNTLGLAGGDGKLGLGRDRKLG